MTLLRARGLSTAFGGRCLFRNLDLEVEPGEAILLTGPNGSGKSTFINTLAGEINPDTGIVEVDGRRASDWSAYEREERCPHVDQIPVVELEVPAVDNLIDSLALGRKIGAWVLTSRRRLRDELLRDLAQTAEDFGIDKSFLRQARELSYGQRRLLAVLRSLRPRRDGTPRVLLLDEPLAGLGTDKPQAVVDAFRQRMSEGWSMVVADHSSTIHLVGVSRVLEFPVNATHDS